MGLQCALGKWVLQPKSVNDHWLPS